MQAEGYFQGAGDETVAVANFETWNNEEQMRFDDEPVKRRIIEFVVSTDFQNTSSNLMSWSEVHLAFSLEPPPID